MADEHLGTDIALGPGWDVSPQPTGDVELVSGRRCLAQGLLMRLATPRGGLWMHPEYGCDVVAYLHMDDTPENRTELELEVLDALLAEPRVAVAQADVLDWEDESVRLAISVVPTGEDNPLNLVVGFGLDRVTVERADA